MLSVIGTSTTRAIYRFTLHVYLSLLIALIIDSEMQILQFSYRYEYLISLPNSHLKMDRSIGSADKSALYTHEERYLKRTTSERCRI
jgi:hypothetical protein